MKIITYAIVIMFLIGMFTTGFFVAKHFYKPRLFVSMPKSPPSVLNVKPTAIYKDSSGVEHYQFTNNQNNYTRNEALRQSSTLLPYIDSLARALNTKSKNIESSVTIQSETKADSTPFYKKQIDSLKRLVFFYNDKYLKLTVRTGIPTDTLDNGSFDFAYNAELNINQYFKRKKILGLSIGAKQSFTDISSSDPRTTIMGVNKFTIRQQIPSYGLRLQGLASYNFNSNSFIAGPALRYDFDKWSLLGAYYYNFSLKDWQPVVNLRYDFIRF